jgi:hypothetical protein
MDHDVGQRDSAITSAFSKIKNIWQNDYPQDMMMGKLRLLPWIQTIVHA